MSNTTEKRHERYNDSETKFLMDNKDLLSVKQMASVLGRSESSVYKRIWYINNRDKSVKRRKSSKKDRVTSFKLFGRFIVIKVVNLSDYED